MLKRVLSLFLLVVMVAVPAATVAANPPTAKDLSSLQAVEDYLKDNLIFREELKSVASEMLVQSGQKEQENIFYTQGGLLENYWPTAEDRVRRDNVKSVIAFAENHDVPVGVVVVPTAAAVKQKLVPDNAPLFNQKEAIAEIYRAMEGKVTATDVYSTLYRNYDLNEEYLYYRTTSRLTALGGYRIYEAVGERLRLSPFALRSYSKEYLVHDYYGELTDSWGKSRVEGDVLAVYSNTSTKRSYDLQVYKTDGTTHNFEGMYPTDGLQQDPFSIYLGGQSAGFELNAREPELERALLVLGDDTVQAVVPFLSDHYDRITYCNPEAASAEDLQQMELEEYDQVLFLYSIETFCDSKSICNIDQIP